MSEIVESKTYEIDELEKVEVETRIDNPNGIETTTIIIYLEDGSFRCFSHEREM
ncbi:hypothetical protein JOC34_000544 [Virgibacillus halotolerans]|uniref:hypothetical protein n=1 Tax=Virgibacillus halotolerans TaxID=1071053 RepID=UPI0019601C27|nr:hypothetical protein [Virgibacillus halotolerans]MBM7598187.1 hypothetical protein [Virgibacillus halotolerans]